MKNKRELIMLPTDNLINCLIKLNIHDEFHSYRWNYQYTQSYLKEANATAYHLYVLSNENFKEGDWVFNWTTNKISKVKEIDNGYVKTIVINDDVYSEYSVKDSFKKIIATTDSSLDDGDRERAGFPVNIFPRISQLFIEYYISEYHQGNHIKEVMVEYEEHYTFSDKSIIGWKVYPTGRFEKLKLSKDNCVELSIVVNENDSVKTITPEEKIKQEAEKRCYPRELDAFISGAKSDSAKEYHFNNLPIDAMKNLIGYIDTPIGRRKYPDEVIENIQLIRKWLEEKKEYNEKK